MAASVYDQAHLARLFSPGDEVARLFSASAEIRAMLMVEGALAKVQGAAGVIPQDSAAAIHRAAMEVSIDAGALAEATAQNGVSVPALVAAFRTEMSAPEHAQYIHWGATSQDIIDSALMLRLRAAVAAMAADLDTGLRALSVLARDGAETPMVARTYGQQGAPTSFGAVVASWGWPLLSARRALDGLVFPVSLSGAVGTGSELGPDPAGIRARVGEALGLVDPGRTWHTDRTPVLEIAHAMGRLVRGFGKLGEDLIAMTQSEIGEVRLGMGGSSSTMPQKQNPVAPSVLVAVARTHAGLAQVLDGAALHRFQRDGAAWFAEWMVLPQIVQGAAAAARQGAAMARAIAPVPEALARPLHGDGLLYAEALSFALAAQMQRPKAQAAIKALTAEVRESGTSLMALAARDYPELGPDLFDPAARLGAAPGEARAFADAVDAQGPEAVG